MKFAKLVQRVRLHLNRKNPLYVSISGMIPGLLDLSKLDPLKLSGCERHVPLAAPACLSPGSASARYRDEAAVVLHEAPSDSGPIAFAISIAPQLQMGHPCLQQIDAHGHETKAH